MKKYIITSCLALMAFSTHAVTTNIKTSVVIAANCEFNIPTISFGLYNPVNQLLIPVPFNVKCSRGINYDLYLNGGNSANVLDRFMKNSFDENLKYNIYRGVDGSGEILGDIHNYGQVTYFRSSGSGQWYTWSFGAKIFTKQFVREGTYSDNITATLVF